MWPMTELWIEPFGGLAGDMLLAAALDLRDERFGISELRAVAESLVPGEAQLDARGVLRGGLRATHLTVRTPESEHAPHRHLSDLVELIGKTQWSSRVRSGSEAVLRCIAEAESKVHGCALEEVHFHEVGAVDTLIDVVGALRALECLGVERVCASPPLLGEGTVECAHGTMPVPAPGTAEILRGLPSLAGGGPMERTTPTGAALYRVLAEGPIPEGVHRTLGVGYGAGTKDAAEGPPNLCRLRLVEPTGSPDPGSGSSDDSEGYREAWLLECNLDDTPAERIGFCIEELRAAGALEVWTSPCQMKKDRPGVVLCALARAEWRGELESVLFRHTPTLGLRWTQTLRREASRERFEIEVLGEPVRFVRRTAGPEGAPEVLSPEFDDLARLARATGRGLAELEEQAIAAAREFLFPT